MSVRLSRLTASNTQPQPHNSQQTLHLLYLPLFSVNGGKLNYRVNKERKKRRAENNVSPTAANARKVCD